MNKDSKNLILNSIKGVLFANPEIVENFLKCYAKISEENKKLKKKIAKFEKKSLWYRIKKNSNNFKWTKFPINLKINNKINKK